MTESMRQTAVPNMPTTRTKFGLVFPTHALATEFATVTWEKTSLQAFRQDMEVRAGPPQDDDRRKARGILLSPVCDAINKAECSGKMRPSYPRSGLAHPDARRTDAGLGDGLLLEADRRREDHQY